MDNLAKEWPLPDGSVHPVFSGITGVIERCSKIALTGINGAGKSTLLKVISGQTEPAAGTCLLGPSVRAGYFSQYSSDLLNPEHSIYEEVAARLPNETIGYIKSLIGSFQFSGGEKSRVVLACLLAQPVNFLILDEPTNHLDIASREVLLEALQDFEGTIIIVSHDRYFLRNVVDHVFEIDHGAMKIFEGDYNYYLEKRECDILFTYSTAKQDLSI